MQERAVFWSDRSPKRNPSPIRVDGQTPSSAGSFFYFLHGEKRRPADVEMGRLSASGFVFIRVPPEGDPQTRI